MNLKNILYTGLLSTALMLTGCSDDEKIPDPLQASDIEVNGAYLKTLESSFVVDLFNIDSSEFSVTLEEHDRLNDGSLIDNVQVYIRFSDLTIDDNGTPDDESDDIDNTKAEMLLETVPGSSFSINQSGFPQVTYTSGVRDAMDALGLADADIDGSDLFFYRFVLNLTDGTSYTNSNSAASILGQPVFNSPFEYSGSVVCIFDEPDFFTGTYQVINTNPGGFGTVFDGIVEVTADPNNPTVRRFDGNWFNFGTVNNYSMTLVCGNIIWDDNQSTGLTCTQAELITLNTPDVFTQFDTTFQDDGVVEVNLSENTADCGGSANLLVTLRFTKQ
ncbi:hypothetical protein [Aquimarina rhabdastrellae]